MFGTDLFAAALGGVFRLPGNGATWLPADRGLGSRTVFELAANSTNLFAGTWAGGVWRYDPSAHLWKAVNNGIKRT